MHILTKAAATAAGLALTAALLISSPARSQTQQNRHLCSSGCRAAYAAIARALPHDRTNELARAIVHTQGFDFVALSRALDVPTSAQIMSRFRALEPISLRR